MERTIGRRSLPALSLHPSAEQLKAAYAINEPLRALLPDGTVPAPKGIYRFKTLDDANRQQEEWLVEAMAEWRAIREGKCRASPD
jgi:hypothetical protein